MPFTTEQVTQRRKAMAEARRKVKQAVEDEAERVRQRDEHRARLERDYPEVPDHDRSDLWSCAVGLTNQLVAQYVSGEPKPRATGIEWYGLFYRNRGNTSLEYLAVLQKMARQYNDIGQIFSLEHLTYMEQQRERAADPRIRVVCVIQPGHR